MPSSQRKERPAAGRTLPQTGAPPLFRRFGSEVERRGPTQLPRRRGVGIGTVRSAVDPATAAIAVE